MAFPGTYNFSYYRGDTYEFNVIPRKSDGTVLDNLSSYTAIFTISTSRGSDGALNQVVAYSNITDAAIECAITPSDSDALPVANTYVYDVEIKDEDAVPYPKTYTVLTGTISVTEQVSGA
jgi:hypothetical protein